MTRIETALVRILLGAQEAGDHNARCIDTGCPVAAELADVAGRGLATLVGVALAALVEAAEAWRDGFIESDTMAASVDDFRAATEPQTKWAETGPGSMHDIVMGATEHSAMTTPTPLRETLATALREGGYVKGVAGRYGHFNDVYWDQSADAILAHPSMQAVAEHEAVGRAVARLLEATKDEAGLALLHVPAGTRPDGRVIATEEGWTVERWASVWGHVTSNGATLPEAIVAALGPSEGERTEAGT